MNTGKKIAVLERRLAHLHKTISAADRTDQSFNLAEAAALAWALDMLRALQQLADSNGMRTPRGEP